MSVLVPDRAGFLALARQGSLVPVYREILADADTPVSAYRKLARREGEGSFLLESVVGGEKWASYSFIGVKPRAVVRMRGGVVEVETLVEGPAIEPPPGADAPEALRAILAAFRPAAPPGLPRFFGGAVGYFGYDVVRQLERIPTFPKDEAREELGLPEALFVLTDTLVIFDNLRQTVKVVATVYTPAGASDRELLTSYDAAGERIDELVRALAAPAPRLASLCVEGTERVALRSAFEREAFLAAVERIKEYILSGDAFQVVLSQRFEADREGTDPFDVYRALRVINPSPYMFHLDFPGVTVTGASPEVLCRLEGSAVEVRPIAGTRRRGATESEDLALEAELRADPKELAEHVMLIDLGRNDVGRVARLGSVEVKDRMVVERYSHVMHIVSHVRGELAPGKGAADVLRATFPAGTLSGAPKIRAMEIIEELEPTRRGIYGGAVGYLSYSGNMDLAIAIRTLVARGDRFYVQAGAGIVHDSVPEAEHQECVSKASAVARAIAVARAAETGEG